MKGLLLKDIYLSAKYCRAYLLIAATFLAASCVGSGNLFFIFYPCLISGMIPVTLLGYDERSKWNEYCGTLPYTGAQIVSGKYWIGLLVQILVLVLSAAVQAVRMHLSGVFSVESYAALLAMLLILSCVTAAIPLPFMFRFGVEKGRVAYYVMLGFVSGGSALAASIFRDDLRLSVGMNTLLILLCIAAVGVYALSWRLSIVLYEKRKK